MEELLEESEREELKMKLEKKIEAIEEEIKHLDSIIEPQDCGHMITARDWLKHRVRQLKGLPEED
jgi:hypothetical protein